VKESKGGLLSKNWLSSDSGRFGVREGPAGTLVEDWSRTDDAHRGEALISDKQKAASDEGSKGEGKRKGKK